MNSSSKTPPRFIPTLTEEVVPTTAPEAASDATVHADEHSDSNSALEESLSEVARVLSQPESHESDAPKARASFHSPWLADGLYVRGKPASIPHDLPPLPESLPPQQPFAQSASVDPSNDQAAALNDVSGVSADELDVDGVTDDAQVEVEAAVEPKSSPLSAHLASEVPIASAADIAEEQLVHRIMQRIDSVLEQRLKAAIEQVVQAQTSLLAQRLREELESVVRHSVHEAVESEIEGRVQRTELHNDK